MWGLNGLKNVWDAIDKYADIMKNEKPFEYFTWIYYSK